MQKYVSLRKFTLSVLTNPALSGGLDVVPGDVLFYDGYNVQFGKIVDTSLSLKTAIAKGWLSPVHVDNEGNEYPEHAVPTGVYTRPVIAEAQEMVANTRMPSSVNNGRQLFSEASSAKRGMLVEDNEGNILGRTSHNTAGTKQNQATQPNTVRTKLAVSTDENTEIVGTVRTDRGIVQKMQKGLPGVETQGMARAVPSRRKLALEEDSSEMNEVEIASRRGVPAKAGKIEVTSATPATEEGMEKAILRNSNIKGISSALSPRGEDMGISELGEGNIDVEMVPISKKIASSADFPKAVDFEAAKAAAVQARRAAKVAVPPPPPPEEEVRVDGFTYTQMHEAGWSDAQLLKSKYAVLVPVVEPVSQPPLPPEETTLEETQEKASAPVANLPEGWEDLKMEEKIQMIESITRIDVLELIRTHKKSHWKVRNAAKARIEVLN